MTQKIMYGISQLPNILAEVGCGNLFLVVDSSYIFLNIKDVIETLPVNRMVLFSDFTPNPLYEQICNGVEMLKEFNSDAIIAIGGGSAIDVAKCIKLAILAQEGNEAIIPPLVSQILSIDSTKIPLIAIPTTAGTGSESTHNAVMYYEDVKQTITNDGIMPNYVVLESSVLKTLPLYQKKCTMMDALCQGIESWWSVNSTEESFEYSRKTIELIMANWQKYIFENDEKAASQIMLAANYSGKAINITQTTAAHAMSYKITSLYKFAHGHAVAVCLPQIWKYMINNLEQCVDIRGVCFLDNIFNNISQTMGCENSIKAISFFERMLLKMELKNPVVSDRTKELKLLSSSVNPIRLRNNPIKLQQDVIYNIYNNILIDK